MARIKLTRIKLRNFSLIRDVSVELTPDLTVITGESGAGKSLLFDAVSFALGERSQRELLAAGATQCEVSLNIEIDDMLAAKLEAPWLPGNNLLQRRLSATGRTRLTLNNASVPVARIQEVAELLFEITGQFESRVLFNPASHLRILDAFGSETLPTLLSEYRAEHKHLHSLSTQLRILTESTGQREQEIEFLRFQVAELEKAAIEPGERDLVSSQLKVAENADALKRAANEAVQLLDGDENSTGAFDLAAQATARITEIGTLLDGAQVCALETDALSDRANVLLEELRDLASACRDVTEAITSDPADAQRLSERMDDIHKLERKYATAANDLQTLLAEKTERLELLTSDTHSPEELEKQLAISEKKVSALAKKLTKLRVTAAKCLHEKAADYLQALGFAHVEMHVALDGKPPAADGADQCEFMVSLNPGEPARPLSRVASGGEASRLLLGIKAALAEQLDYGVLLLDEVEAGLGGDTATKVANVLKQLAVHRQVIAITHLPTVAVYGQIHLLATKAVSGNQTTVSFEAIQNDARTNELTRMLGESGGKEEQALVDKLLADATSCD